MLSNTVLLFPILCCLALQLCEAFDLLGADSDLLLELDGFTVISNSPLSLFRDGDTVTIRSKGQTMPVTNSGQAQGGKRKRSEVALAPTAAGNYGNTFDGAFANLCCAVDGILCHVVHLLRLSQDICRTAAKSEKPQIACEHSYCSLFEQDTMCHNIACNCSVSALMLLVYCASHN